MHSAGYLGFALCGGLRSPLREEVLDIFFQMAESTVDAVAGYASGDGCVA
jgi:hypothetical protein